MRTDNPDFALANESAHKDQRFVVEQAFDEASTILWYFTSHPNTPVPVGASVIQDVVRGLSMVSQTLNPDTANSVIGKINYDLIDRQSQVTALLAGEIALGRSTRLQRTRVYKGMNGLAFDKFVLRTTQLVDEIEYLDANYKFSCLDVQRELHEQIFEPVVTNLQSSVGIGDMVINVFDTSAFELLAHGTSYSDAPGQTVLYTQIDAEVIRCSGKTPTTFVVDTNGRGALNTRAAEHVVDAGQSADRRTRVEEYPYFEMPLVKFIYALLTGILHNQGGATLPAGRHLGVPTEFVRLSDFTDIGTDLWDPADDTKGFKVRFSGLTKRKGKEFIEKELLLLRGLFMPIYADGALGLRRMAEVKPGAAYSGTLDKTNVVSHGALKDAFRLVRNVFEIAWNYEPIQKATTRLIQLIDFGSRAIYKEAEPLRMKFIGLSGDIHTAVTLAQLFDNLRDRYSGAPLLLDAKLHESLDPIEVADVRRVQLDTLRDPFLGGPLDRSFEVQQVSDDMDGGDLSVKLFASSRTADPLAATADNTVLPDPWWTSEGTDLSTVLTITGANPGHVSANGTLNGGADMNAPESIFYYDGDLVIDPGVVVRWTGNVQLRIKFPTFNGTFDGKGGGHAGAVNPGAVYQGVTLGTPGFIGTAIAGGGVHVVAPLNNDIFVHRSFQGAVLRGLNDVVPPLTLEWDGNVLKGLPADCRGTSGSSGAVSARFQGSSLQPAAVAAAGDGGASGGGLIIISRGGAFGAAGKIILSGADGTTGQQVVASGGRSFYSGSGAGGQPGAAYWIMDGALATVPTLNTATAVALGGRAPVPAGALIAEPSLSATPPAGAYYSFFTGPSGEADHPVPDLSGGRGAFRVQFVPGNVAAEPDPLAEFLAPPTNIGLASGTAELLLQRDGTVVPRIKVTWQASVDNRTRGYDVESKKSTDTIWTAIAPVAGINTTTAWIVGVQSGVNYDVRVRSGDGLRGVSVWVSVPDFPVVGKIAEPTDVNALSLAFDDTFFSWDDIPDLDRLGFVVRFQDAVFNDWNTATPAHGAGHIPDTEFDTRHLVGGLIRLLVKSIDTSENLATNAASLVVDLRPASVTGLAFNDTFFSWTESPESDRKGYVVRFQPAAEDNWDTAAPAHGDAFITDTRFDTRDLVGGLTRLLVKPIDHAGNPSAAATSLVVDLRPPAPDVFKVRTQADGTRQFDFATTSPPSDMEGGGAVIRFAVGISNDWATMQPLHDGLLLASPFETNQLAAGIYTFAIKNVDVAGNESETPTFISGTLPNPRIPAFVHQQTEEPTWAGTKTNCSVDEGTGWLLADSTGVTWDSLPATWDQWTSWNLNPISPIQYQIEIDLGVIFTFAPLVTVFADGTVTIEESHSDDGISFSPLAVAGPELTTRVIRVLVTVSGTYSKIKSMRTILGGRPLEQITEDLDISTLTGAHRLGIGHFRVPLTEPFKIIRYADLTLQSVGPGWDTDLISKTDLVNGPEFKIYNGAGVLADPPSLDAFIRGL